MLTILADIPGMMTEYPFFIFKFVVLLTVNL